MRHNEHAGRYEKKRNNKKTKNYTDGTYKTLITIGSNEQEVRQRMIETTPPADLEFVGLVVSLAHDCYNMLVKPPNGNIEGPFFFACDRVAKSLEPTPLGGYRVVPAQQVSSAVTTVAALVPNKPNKRQATITAGR